MRVSIPPAPGSERNPADRHLIIGNESIALPAAARPSGLEKSVEPPGLHKGITPGALLEALSHRKVEAAVVGIVLAIAVAGVTWSIRGDKFTSEARLQIATHEKKILHDPTRPPDTDWAFAKTQIALIRSRPVLRAALKNEKVRQLPIILQQPDPIEWLEKELKAESVEGTEIVKVSLTIRGDGSDLATIVNAVIEAYLAEVVRGETAMQQGRLTDLSKLYTDIEEKLRTARQGLNDLSRNLKGGDPKILTLKQQTLIAEYSTLNSDLRATNTKIRDLEIRTAVYCGRLGKGDVAALPYDPLVERDLDLDPAVVAQQAEIVKLQTRLKKNLDIDVGGQSSLTKDMQRELESAKEQMAKIRADRRTEITARHQKMSQENLAAALREGDSECAQLKAQRDGLQTEINKLKDEADKLGLSHVELDLRRGEIARLEELLKKIWEQKEMLELELKGAARGRVTVRAQAEDASVMSKSGRVVEAAGGGMAGLCLGLFAVGFRELRRGTIYTSTCVSKGLGLRVLGSLPVFDQSPTADSNGLTPVPWASRIFVDSVDGLRAIIMRELSVGGFSSPEPAGQPRATVLMVVSAVPGEGKTTLTSQLSMSFARTSRRILVIDFDLRSPALDRAFGLVNPTGLLDWLAARGTGSGRKDREPTQTLADDLTALDKLIVPSRHEHLDILPAGTLSADDDDTGILQSAAVGEILDHFRGSYDYILIDSSPVLLVPDAFLIGPHADALLLSVRPGVSRMADVHAGFERLLEHRLPILGVVVDGVEPNQGYAKAYGYGTQLQKAEVP